MKLKAQKLIESKCALTLNKYIIAVEKANSWVIDQLFNEIERYLCELVIYCLENDFNWPKQERWLDNFENLTINVIDLSNIRINGIIWFGHHNNGSKHSISFNFNGNIEIKVQMELEYYFELNNELEYYCYSKT